MVSIPENIAAEIDRIVGHERRAQFIAEVLEREVRRQEQMAALHEAVGSWKDEDHPELASGSDAFIRDLRDKASHRLEAAHADPPSR